MWNAIGDLPEVEGGWRPEGGADGWADYDGPVTSFQRRMREGMDGEDAAKVFDHITRPVREDDERAFQLMDATTRYSDLPADMRRYRDDIFDDKYKRLDENDLSRTITAHIAKDGYWYIHPTAEPHPDRPRGGPAADLPGPVPVRRAARPPRSGRSATPSRPRSASSSAGRSAPAWTPLTRQDRPRRRSPGCWPGGSVRCRCGRCRGCRRATRWQVIVGGDPAGAPR